MPRLEHIITHELRYLASNLRPRKKTAIAKYERELVVFIRLITWVACQQVGGSLRCPLFLLLIDVSVF